MCSAHCAAVTPIKPAVAVADGPDRPDGGWVGGGMGGG